MNKHKISLPLLLLLCACTPDKPAEQPAQTAALPPPTTTLPAAKAASAETMATYSWESESCRYTGRYNPSKYSKEQLDNVQQLLFGNTMLASKTTVYSPEDAESANMDTLMAEYNRQIQLYRNMRVLPQPTWVRLKKQAIQEIEEDYKAQKLYVQAFTNPGTLLTTSPGACKQYIEGLATGNDSLVLQNWRSFVEQQKQRSGSFGPYEARYHADSSSPDHLVHAKQELLTFGWLNCLNASIRRVERTEKLYRQFDQLFVGITSECDDVD